MSDGGWKITVKQVDHDGQTVLDSVDPEVYRSKHIAIATGHHAKPSIPHFPGQGSFKGLHCIVCVKYLDK